MSCVVSSPLAGNRACWASAHLVRLPPEITGAHHASLYLQLSFYSILGVRCGGGGDENPGENGRLMSLPPW